MRADYRVDELITEEETGEVIAKCFDTFYEEEFEKYLGMPDEWDGKQNASTLLKDSSYFMSDEIRQELMTTFGVEEFDAEEENPGYQFYDFGDDDDEDEDEEEFAVPTKNVRRESFDLREALNEIDLRTDNRYDLLNLYEACDLSGDEKKKLATVVYDQEDASVIYDTLNDRYITGKEIDIPERVKDGVIHEGMDENKLLTEATFRGVPNTIFIGHGSWSDPEIATEYEGKTYVANYWEIEDSFYHYYLEEKEYAETHTDKYAQDLKNTYTFDSSDDDFEKFLHNHADEVVSDIIELGKVEEDDLDESKSIEEAVEYEVYFDSGISDEDEFFTDLRQAKKYAKQLVNKYGPKDGNAPAIIKKNNGDSLPDNWDVVDKIYYNTESKSIKEELYKDVSGIMGEPNETYSEEDLENYWNSQKDNDPSLRAYSNYNSWLRDTISNMEEVEGVEESKSSDEFEFDDEFNAYYDGYTEEDEDKNSAYNKLKRNTVFYI
jgi:hypothetical protein